jgi:hypothetical protein
VPGVTLTVCEALVAPLLQRSETGALPPVGVAVQLMLVALGTPTHVTVKVLAYAAENGTMSAAARPEAMIVRRFISD